MVYMIWMWVALVRQNVTLYIVWSLWTLAPYRKHFRLVPHDDIHECKAFYPRARRVINAEPLLVMACAMLSYKWVSVFLMWFLNFREKRKYAHIVTKNVCNFHVIVKYLQAFLRCSYRLSWLLLLAFFCRSEASGQHHYYSVKCWNHYA